MGKIFARIFEGIFYVVLLAIAAMALYVFATRLFPTKEVVPTPRPVLTNGTTFASNLAISDETLLTSATTPYNSFPGNSMQSRAIGKSNGEQVVVDYVCADICPNYTMRIVHFDVPRNKNCASIGGIEKIQQGSDGWAAGTALYCFPKVIVDNWAKYIATAHIRESEPAVGTALEESLREIYPNSMGIYEKNGLNVVQLCLETRCMQFEQNDGLALRENAVIYLYYFGDDHNLQKWRNFEKTPQDINKQLADMHLDSCPHDINSSKACIALRLKQRGLHVFSIKYHGNGLQENRTKIW